MQCFRSKQNDGFLGMEESLIASLSVRIRGHAPREALAKRVASALREDIASGRLKPGTRLANEVALAKALDISRPTLREAIRVLSREGLLRVKHGIGTFVAEETRLIWGRLDSMRSMTDLIRSVGGAPGDSDLRVETIPAPADVAAALEVAPGAVVALVSRVRLIDKKPLAIANEYIALDGAKADFAKVRRFRGGSLYKFLRERCGLTLSHSSLVIASVAADPTRARQLGLRQGTPLLLLRETHVDVEGRPVLFTVNYHNSEIVEFTLARAGLVS
jgi:DNA-binding GntR family transcriptional regulator